MIKGFYNLTSGMLTQGRKLDVVANNMTNVSTPGYKTDQFTSSTFQSAVISRVGNKDKSGAREIGRQDYMLAPSRLYTDYTQGALEESGMPLDFAIEGEGFFAVQTDNGVAYTRAGNFSLDGEGYLCLPGHGRVLDPDSQPILLRTDKVYGDSAGAIYTEGGNYLGRLGVFRFADNDQLAHGADGLFTPGGQQANLATPPIHNQMLERANVDLVKQMTDMMSAERALQSAAQVAKMYDTLMTKAANDVGRL